jgi:peptidoglycan-associated lipoprotein
MRKSWAHIMTVLSIIGVLLSSGCAGDLHVGPSQELPLTKPADNHSSSQLTPDKQGRNLPIEKRASLPSLEYAINIFLNQNIQFGFNAYEISPEAAEILKDKAAFLARYPQYRVEIEGHCDERGSIEYNLALGDRRACSARDYLVRLGINPERIQTISYGKERPLDPDHTEEAWTDNRRDHFNLIKP